MKYNNIPTNYNGNLYPSKGEAGYARYLDGRLSRGEIVEWKRQVPFTLYHSGKKDSVIVVDFLVTFSRKQEIHEFKKGLITDTFLRKLYLFTQCYPYFPYLVVEDGRHGYTYNTPDSYLKPLSIPKTSPVKKYAKHEIVFAYLLHKIAGLFMK